MFSHEELDASAFERFACPGCSEDVDVSAESVGKLVRCPYCSSDFFASVDQLHQPVVDDTDPGMTELDRESTFDKLRIQNYTALRMGAIRARSWWLIGLFLAILVILDMLGNTFLYVWIFHRWGIGPTARISTSILTTMFARHAWYRMAMFQRELTQSSIPEPSVPPDFSTLDNGSERWKHLENIQ